MVTFLIPFELQKFDSNSTVFPIYSYHAEKLPILKRCPYGRNLCMGTHNEHIMSEVEYQVIIYYAEDLHKPFV